VPVARITPAPRRRWRASSTTSSDCQGIRMPDYYEFDVRLQHIEPTIWRRFQLPTDASFLDLHYAIQAACGWDNAHLYAFRTTRGRTIAGIPMDTWGTPDPDAAEVRLSTFFSGSPKCIYEYDFGDSWLHDVARVGSSPPRSASNAGCWTALEPSHRRIVVVCGDMKTAYESSMAARTLTSVASGWVIGIPSISTSNRRGRRSTAEPQNAWGLRIPSFEVVPCSWSGPAFLTGSWSEKTTTNQ
jgi:hypothetical protein